jgi:hypothetical protein
MKRITFEKKIAEIDFCPRIYFYKDGKEFARLSMELFQDLTFKSPEGYPFKGPEFTMDEAYEETLHALKYELDDPDLNEELEEVLKNLKNNNQNTK